MSVDESGLRRLGDTAAGDAPDSRQGTADRAALPRPAPPRPASPRPAPLVDPFGRAIHYLRVSVTDRCDFRCVYCMPEGMSFLPKADLLTLEELDRVCSAFIRLGTRKLRITGGEPLVRRNLLHLFRRLGRHLDSGALDELTLTTNAGRLAEFAAPLRQAGVRRVNVSLDSLDRDRFAAITRRGRLDRVMAGIDAADRAGLAVKVNMLALKGVNDDEFDRMIAWCGDRGFDLTLIEVMPMGDIGNEQQLDRYLPLSAVREGLSRRWTLQAIPYRSGGPARYVRIAETGGRLGFITPLSHGFCEDCDRLRLTCTGTVYMCLGREDAADLRAPLRAGAGNEGLEAAIRAAVSRKPEGHHFGADCGGGPPVSRPMAVTGG